MVNYDLILKQGVNISSYEKIHRDKKYSENIIEDAYLDEILTFFDVIKGKATPLYSIEEDECVLGLIDKIER